MYCKMKQIFFLIIAIIHLTCCSESIEDFPKSNLRAISSFTFEPYHNAENNIVIQHVGKIDEVNKIIKVHLPSDVILTNLRPKIVLSPWTTVNPASLEYVDFVKDTVDFTVTAQSGKKAVYSVVRVLDFVYSSAELYSISFPEILNEQNEPIRFTYSSFTNNTTISAKIPADYSIGNLLVRLEFSPASRGCRVEVSEDGLETSYRTFSNDQTVNFTNRVSFRVTSQSGSKINYRINVTQ